VSLAHSGPPSGRTALELTIRAGTMMLTPSQLRAKEDILRAVHAQAPLIELRSPSKTRTRGHGVTTVLAAVAEELGVKKVLGVGDALCEDGRPDAASQIYSAALEQLASCGIAIIDDLDLAVAPRTVKRSRTLVESLQGSASVYQWGADATAPRVLKALVDGVDAADAEPHLCLLCVGAGGGARLHATRRRRACRRRGGRCGVGHACDGRGPTAARLHRRARSSRRPRAIVGSRAIT